MDLINQGQKITLYFQKDSNMVEMACQIEKVFDDRLELLLPQYFMRYIKFLEVGCELTAKIFSKNGTIDFKTIIINSPLEEAFVIELDYNSIYVTPSEDITYISSIEKLEVILPNNSIVKTKSIEIAGDYIKFISNEKLNIDDVIEGVLFLPKEYGIIKFKAEVSEIDSIYDTEYTAKYITMTEQDKQTLLYYMYMYNNDLN